MEREHQAWQPLAGPFVVRFQVNTPIQRPEVEPLLRELICEVPVAPQEGELTPGGEGWIRYEANDELTIDDRDEIVAWLRNHPRLSAVRCVTGLEM